MNINGTFILSLIVSLLPLRHTRGQAHIVGHLSRTQDHQHITYEVMPLEQCVLTEANGGRFGSKRSARVSRSVLRCDIPSSNNRVVSTKPSEPRVDVWNIQA